MLEPYIIEEIKKREEEKRRRFEERPQLPLPLPEEKPLEKEEEKEDNLDMKEGYKIINSYR